VREADLEELRRVVHQLKGAGGGYGFDAITTHAAGAEQRIQAGAEISEITAQVNALTDLIRRIEGYQPAKENPHNVGTTTEAPRHGGALVISFALL